MMLRHHHHEGNHGCFAFSYSNAFRRIHSSRRHCSGNSTFIIIDTSQTGAKRFDAELNVRRHNDYYPVSNISSPAVQTETNAIGFRRSIAVQHTANSSTSISTVCIVCSLAGRDDHDDSFFPVNGASKETSVRLLFHYLSHHITLYILILVLHY
jgi:hypothetical protein